MEIGNDIKWTNILEKFFKDMGEKSYCYSYLHKKAEAEFSYIRNFIDLPVIVLSTIAGTLSIGNSSIFGPENERQAGLGIGLLSLCVSVLNTCGTYFSFAKRSETHRLSHIQYAKLFRFLSIELSLPRDERMRPNDLLKISRDTFERLAEVSPLIPYKILKTFKKMFKSYDVSKPSETNGLEKIEIYDNDDFIGVKKIVSPGIAENIIRNMGYTEGDTSDTGMDVMNKKIIRAIDRSGGATVENIKNLDINRINKINTDNSNTTTILNKPNKHIIKNIISHINHDINHDNNSDYIDDCDSEYDDVPENDNSTEQETFGSVELV